MGGGLELLLILFVFVILPILIVTGILFAIRFIIRSAKEKPKQETGSEEVADELKKLAELHEQGVLTDEEFNEQKKKLLK